jgi:hypothetical protein
MTKRKSIQISKSKLFSMMKQHKKVAVEFTLRHHFASRISYFLYMIAHRRE